MTATRRLAAILAADVAGYSRLMGADEEGTLERLKALRRELLDPKIAEHHGRIVKTTGDGLLVEFSSVVDAVRCGVEMQQAMVDRNTDIVADNRIELRIGINLGDVIVEDDDLYGDGVNIAARVEALADPGGVFVSNTVYDHVRDRLPFDFEDLGEQQVKNIARPVRVYHIRDTAAKRLPTALPLPAKPSIAVLPFANMSGDPEQEYFADGIAEDIITLLSKSRALFVIARNSTFTYKGRAADVRQIGRELGVRYVLEGSVRKAGNRVRVTGQLIEAATGGISGPSVTIGTSPISSQYRIKSPPTSQRRYCRQWSAASASAPGASPPTVSTLGSAITVGCGISPSSRRSKIKRPGVSSCVRSILIRNSPRQLPRSPSPI